MASAEDLLDPIVAPLAGAESLLDPIPTAPPSGSAPVGAVASDASQAGGPSVYPEHSISAYDLAGAATVKAALERPPEPQYPEWLRKFEFLKRGLNQTLEGLVGTATGGGKPLFEETGLQVEPTITERAIQGVTSLASPASLLAFIAGGGLGLAGVKSGVQFALQKFGPQAVSKGFATLAGRVASGASGFGLFDATKEALEQAGAIQRIEEAGRTGAPLTPTDRSRLEEQRFGAGQVVKEAGKGVVTGAALGATGAATASLAAPFRYAAEVGVLATVPAAVFEQRAPTQDELLDAGILVAVFKIGHRLAESTQRALAKPRAERSPIEQRMVDNIPERTKGLILRETFDETVRRIEARERETGQRIEDVGREQRRVQGRLEGTLSDATQQLAAVARERAGLPERAAEVDERLAEMDRPDLRAREIAAARPEVQPVEPAESPVPVTDFRTETAAEAVDRPFVATTERRGVEEAERFPTVPERSIGPEVERRERVGTPPVEPIAGPEPPAFEVTDRRVEPRDIGIVPGVETVIGPAPEAPSAETPTLPAPVPRRLTPPRSVLREMKERGSSITATTLETLAQDVLAERKNIHEVTVDFDRARLPKAANWLRRLASEENARKDLEFGQEREARDRVSDESQGTLFEQRSAYRATTETPAFRSWFGASKVVDGDGSAKVVYHGTGQPGFEAVDPAKLDPNALYGPGFYTTESSDVAGGIVKADTEIRFFPTKEAAEAAPQRSSYVWRAGPEYGVESGTWATAVELPFTAKRGYAHKAPPQNLTPDEINARVAAIRGSREFARMMERGYLSEGERRQAEHDIEEYAYSGNPMYLDMLAGQPYNLNAHKILERAGLVGAGGVYPVYVKIERPFDVDDVVSENLIDRLRSAVDTRFGRGTADYAIARLEDAAEQVNITGDLLYNEFSSHAQTESGRSIGRAAINDALRSLGYDGITHMGGARPGTPAHRVWIAFDPTQVKSATGNRGTFSPDDPSMLREGAAPRWKEREPGNQQAALDLKTVVADLDEASGAQSLSGRTAAPSGVRTLASGVSADFQRTGRLNLRGRSIRSAHDIGALGVLIRNPKVENLRLFYTNDEGEVLAHETLSSRAPNAVQAFLSVSPDTLDAVARARHGRAFKDLNHEKQAGIQNETSVVRHYEDIRDRMRRLGATKVWLEHNHPSGRPVPSAADARLTVDFARAVPGFQGHVVIDHETYAFISGDAARSAKVRPNGTADVDVQMVDAKTGAPDPLLTPGVPHETIGWTIRDSHSAADTGRTLTDDPNALVAMFRDGSGGLRAAQQIPRNLYLRVQEFQDWIRGQRRAFGGMDVIMWGGVHDPDIARAAEAHLSAGTIMDHVYRGRQQRTETARGQRAGRGVATPRGFTERGLRSIRVEEGGAPYEPERDPDTLARDIFARTGPNLGRFIFEYDRETGSRAGAADAFRRVSTAPEAPGAEAPPGDRPPEGRRITEDLPPLTESKFTIGRHRTVVEAATEVMLNQGIPRDPARFPLISDQILDLLREDRLPLPELREAGRRRGLTVIDIGDYLFRPTIRSSAQNLAALSVAARKLKQLSRDPDATGEQARTLLEWADDLERIRQESGEDPELHLQSLWRRGYNVWRGMLTGQLATAVRNANGQVGRLGIDVLDRSVQRLFGGTGSGADPWVALESLGDALSQFRPTPGGFRARRQAGERIDQALGPFPKQWSRLFGTYSSDISRQARTAPEAGPISGPERTMLAAEKTVEIANWANRFQEFVVRRAVFWPEFDWRLQKHGMSAEDLLRGTRTLTEDELSIVETDARAAIGKALELTFADSPPMGEPSNPNLGWTFIKAMNKTAGLLGTIPFPRFLVAALKFQYEFSPLPVLTGHVFTAAERAKFRAGDRQTISRATIGTAAFLAAWIAREQQDDGLPWYTFDIPGLGLVDTRPYNPYASFFFLGEMTKRARKGTLFETPLFDVVQGVASVNLRGGLGLYVLDKAWSGIGVLSKTSLPSTLKGYAGEAVAGLLTPLRTLTDLYSAYDPDYAIVRERRTEPFLGPSKAVLGMGEPAYAPTRAEPMRRESGALRQLTGITKPTEPNAAEREFTRLQFSRRDILPATGVPEADAILSRHMGSLVEERLVPRLSEPGYLARTNAGRALFLQKALAQLRQGAMRGLSTERRDLFLKVKDRRVPSWRHLFLEERRGEPVEVVTP